MACGDSPNLSDELANKTMNEEIQKDLELWDDSWKKLHDLSSEMIQVENILLNIKAKDLNRRGIKDGTLHKIYSNTRLMKQMNNMVIIRTPWWSEFKQIGPYGIFLIFISLVMVKFSNLRK